MGKSPFQKRNETPNSGVSGATSLNCERSSTSAGQAKPRYARLDGFSLHADVAVPAHTRERLDPICRYLLRPPLALERLRESSGGQLM